MGQNMYAGRYNLVVKYLDEKEIVVLPIIINENDPKQFNVKISAIDLLTTCFNNEEHLINRLYDNGYIKDKNVKIFIRYKYNDMYRTLDVLYKPHQRFPKFITNNYSVIEKNNSYYINEFNNIINKINNIELRKYILNSYKINLKIKQIINELFILKSQNDIDFCKNKLFNYLSNYRDLRNIVLLIDNYEKNKNLNNYNINKIKEEKNKKINIKIPMNYYEINTDKIDDSINYPEINTDKMEDTISWLEKDKDIKEQIDLDDLLLLSNDEAEMIGFDIEKYDEYSKSKSR